MSEIHALLFVLFALARFAESESACVKNFGKKQFVITSENYPEPYPGNVSCTFFLQGSECPRKYNFQFLDFDLENDEECAKDYLEVERQGRLCGSKTGVKTFPAPNGSLVLKFVTNAEVNKKGFKLLVTKLPCEEPQKQNFYNFDWKQISGWNLRKPYQPQTNQFCCKETYNARHFFLTSPGFPSSNQPSDCIYRIFKANQNVCRLRIHFLYFSHGGIDGSCSGNFLEIDGKKLCGCRSDLKLVTPFDLYSINAPKLLSFKSDGFHRNERSGFVLEVFQDECPWKYSPEGLTPPRLQKRETSFENAKLIFESVESPQMRQIMKHFYFFSDPEEVNHDYFPLPEERPKDREETDYIDTSDKDFHLTESTVEQCANFDFNQLPQNDLECKPTGSNEGNCVELNSLKGYFQSPGYPFYYPGQLNLCYRFRKQPGYCSAKLKMVDFQIEYSADCAKDYLLLGSKFRYCGQQLRNTISTLDLNKSDFEDVIFVTDSYYCDRGFKAVYEQIPCFDVQTTTLEPSIITQNPLVPCNSYIYDKTFVLNIFAAQEDTCVFTVVKSDSEICRLDLQSLLSNLDCNSEDVFVKGRSLCSLTESDSFSVDFKDDSSIPIVYKRFIQNPGLSGLRVRLSGKQSSENCLYNTPEVPAERLASYSSSYGFFIVLKSSTKDLCGIIANTTFADSPRDSCKILMESGIVASCIPDVETNLSESPSNAEKLQLLLYAKKAQHDVTVQKVDCDYMSVVP